MKNAGNVSDKPSYTFWVDVLANKSKLLLMSSGQKYVKISKEAFRLPLFVSQFTRHVEI